MSERQTQRYLLIDIGMLAFGEYFVVDNEYRVVQEFETEAEAEAFVADANGTDVETVRRETTERAKMLVECRENLIRHSREGHKP